MIRSKMVNAKLPLSFLRDDVPATTYILNSVPRKNSLALDMSYVHKLTHKHRKVSHRATKMLVTRYAAHYKGYVMHAEHPNGDMMKKG